MARNSRMVMGGSVLKHSTLSFMSSQKNMIRASAGSSLSFGSDDKEAIKAHIEKNNKLNKKQFDDQLKNLKPVVFEEAKEFLEKEAEHLTQSITKMHHLVINQFIKFKSRNENIIKERDILLKNWRTTEMALALRSPVAEAFHGLQE